MLLHVQWKAENAAGNWRAHGVWFDEAASVLGDPFSRTIADPEHPADDSRFVTLGLSHRARTLVVSHVDHGRALWIVSARRAIQSRALPGRRAGAAVATPSFRDYDFSTGARGKYAARYWEAVAQRPAKLTVPSS